MEYGKHIINLVIGTNGPACTKMLKNILRDAVSVLKIKGDRILLPMPSTHYPYSKVLGRTSVLIS